MSGMNSDGEPPAPFLDPRIMEDDWRHDVAEYARTAAGGQEPTLSSAGHDAKVRQIAADSDTISALHAWSEANSEFAQTDPQCSGTTCTWGDPANPPITKENFISPEEDITIFPVMRRNGAELHISEFTGANQFGPWIGTTYAAVLDHMAVGSNYQIYDSGQEGSGRYVWGNSTGSNPVTGAATWSGVLVGVGGRPNQGEAFQYVQGDVDVTANFGGGTTLDVMFFNVKGAEYAADYTIDPWMGVPVSGGSFEDGDYFDDGAANRYIEGKFYGPNAEEVGGLFRDNSVSDADTYIDGAFAAAHSGQ